MIRASDWLVKHGNDPTSDKVLGPDGGVEAANAASSWLALWYARDHCSVGRILMAMLLHIDSSPRARSVSSGLAREFAVRWKRQNPAGTVVHHNTTLEAVPYLNETMIDAFNAPEAALSGEQKRVLSYSDTLVDELLAADVLVIGAPMWNLGIPGSLKAWIDMIVREGRTFVFTDQGVEPLVPAGKRVYVFSTRGGAYPRGTQFHALDQQEPYLRMILGMIGLTEIEFIYAELQSGSAKAAADSVAQAERAMAMLVA
jgi:FMN-dependent NADH-azoreductase